MNTSIPFLGIDTASPDGGSQLGALHIAANVVNSDGAIRPFPGIHLVDELDDSNIYYIHNVGSGVRNYIGYRQVSIPIPIKNPDGSTGTIYEENFSFVFVKRSADGKFSSVSDFFQVDISDDFEVLSINASGNILIVIYKSSGITENRYFIFQNGSYSLLGDHLPEIPIHFYLFDTTIETKVSDSGKDGEWLRSIRNYLSGQAAKNGRFLYPFFVRYALRLADNTLTMHSAPVLMPCNSIFQPLILNGSTPQAITPSHRLGYFIDCNQSVFNAWKDIVTSIDIFISKPIVAYDDMNSFGEDDKSKTSASSLSFESIVRNAGIDHISPAAESGLNHYTFFSGNNYAIQSADYEPLVSSVSSFFLLHSIDFTSVKSTREKCEINIASDYLTSLEARESLVDDSDASHNRIIASNAIAYNKRLHLTGVSTVLFSGFVPQSDANIRSEAEYGTAENDSYDYTPSAPLDLTVRYRLQKYGKSLIVGNDSTISIHRKGLIPMLYYPDLSADTAFICASRRDISTGAVTKQYFSINLKPHDFLNGSYAWLGWNRVYASGDLAKRLVNSGTWTVNEISESEFPELSEDLSTLQPNYLYYSEAGMPFAMQHSIAVGNGTVIGIATAARPISQGQFGQFPLYAFCSDGVYALSVSATGVYSSVDNVSQEVCVSSRCIAPLESEVAFATARGIMLISGGQVSCITTNFDTRNRTTSIPDGWLANLCVAASMKISQIRPVSITDYINGAGIAFAYNRQLIVVFNPAYNFYYLYSLDSQLWFSAFGSFSRTLNAYPDSILISSEGSAFDFNDVADVAHATGLILTRPFTLGTSDAFSTISRLLLRGSFPKSSVDVVLFGSRDLQNWLYVTSSKSGELRSVHGSPYRYFRLALILRLKPNESISSASIEFSTKYTNKLR